MSLSHRSEPSATLTPTREARRSFWLQYLSLFSSLGTLLCCALPSLLVLLGLGASVASVVSSLPWIVVLSHHKRWVFAVAGVLIAISFIQTYAVAPRLRDNNEICEPGNPADCDTA